MSVVTFAHFHLQHLSGMLFYFCNDRINRNKERTFMNWLITTYAAYLLISVCLTVWVARTLHKNGRIFLVDSFLGNEPLADSVNHLLVVGFYLINIGYVTLALKYGGAAGNPQEAVETLSTKIGMVLLVLGGMHFFNLAVFSKMRKRALHRPPPITGYNPIPTGARPA
jgi:uncharacterized membrane protein YidH (DUF202 family)